EATTIEWIRQPETWDPGDPTEGLGVLMGRIDRLIPQNHSPIAEALVLARRKGFPAANEYEGPRVVLVLTDGDDNLFDFAPWAQARWPWNQTKDIREFLKNAFRGSRIEVNVLCFTQDQTEAKRARDQFDVVQEMDPRGTFQVEPQPGRLAARLEMVMRP